MYGGSNLTDEQRLMIVAQSKCDTDAMAAIEGVEDIAPDIADPESDKREEAIANAGTVIVDDDFADNLLGSPHAWWTTGFPLSNPGH